MAKYEGFIGKLSQDIFNGSGQGSSGAARYAAIGSATGAGIGGIQGSLSDEGSFGGGLVRGAVAGAAGGAGVNLIPKMLSHNMNASGLKPYENFQGLASQAIDDFKPVNDYLTSPKMKEVLSDFKPIRDNNIKNISNPKAFAMGVDQDFIKARGRLNPDDFTDLTKYMETATQGFDNSAEGVQFNAYLNNTRDKFFAMNKPDQAKAAGSFAATLGFNSAYKHIVEPTGDFITKFKAGQSTNLYEKSAAAFSAFGLYEGLGISKDVSEGNWGSAAAGLGLLVGGKALYSQGVSGFRAANFLKSKGVSVSDAVNTSKVMAAGQIYRKGVGMYTPEDHLSLATLATAQQKFKTAVI